MRKRIKSLLLSLVLCMGLTVPALAADLSLSDMDIVPTVRCTSTADQNGVIQLSEDAPILTFEITKDADAIVESAEVYIYDASGAVVAIKLTGAAPETWKGKTSGTITLDPTDPAISCNTTYSCQAYVTVDGDICRASTVYFRINSTAKTYSVNFYTDLLSMNSLGTLQQTNGESWVLPNTPSKSGKTFQGWKLVSGSMIDPDSPVALTRDDTAYGVWADNEPAAGTAFSDVPTGAYYYDAVQWAVNEGITNGTSAATFSPDQKCTRAEIVTFLWRAAGSPKTEHIYGTWDVTADKYYFDAVQWAAELDMTPHLSNFYPNDPCTRLMAVEFMWKSAGSPSAARASFSDVASSAVDWAVSEGVTTGTSSTQFSPNETCTRGQIVTFLYRGFAE